MLVDTNKITIVLDAAFSVEIVGLDACKLLEFGLLLIIGTSNPTVVAAGKALSVEDGATWSTFVVPTAVFETTSEQGTYWADRHRRLHDDHNTKHCASVITMRNTTPPKTQ